MLSRSRATTLVLLACACLVVHARPAAAAEYDRSFAVQAGMQLAVRLFGGEIVVRAWDRDFVRVRATHFATDSIDVRTNGRTMSVRARATVGRPHAIDLTIDAPSWMPLAVAGTYVDVSISGARASVSAETVRGDVRVRGGLGTISLKSIEGQVVLEDAAGSASLSAVSNGIRVRRLDGDLVAVTVNGSVTLEDVRSRSVDVGTVGGDVSWKGPLAAAGRYQFATHGGDIDVSLGVDANATVAVRMFDGHFRSAYPVQPMPAASGAAVPSAARNVASDGVSSVRKTGKSRFTFVLGSGAAHLDLETFRGTISLRP